MTLTYQALVGNQVLVSGTDVAGNSGRCTLDSSEWESVKAETRYSQSAEDFDEAVKDFFAPILEAAEKAEAAIKQPELDPDSFVVLTEPIAGVAAQPGRTIELGHDAVVLRLLESGKVDRLVWVNDHELAVLAAQPAVPVSTGTQASAETPTV